MITLVVTNPKTNPNMAQIRFNVKPIANGKMQIRAIFQDGLKQKTKNTGETIPSNKVKDSYKYWDVSKQVVRGLDSAHRINSMLSKWKSDFATYKDNCKRANIKIDVDDFISILSGTTVSIAPTASTLLSIIKQYLVAIKSTHHAATQRAYKVLENDLKEFELHMGKSYTVADIDKQFYKQFSDYLMSEELNQNGTVMGKQKKIVAMLNYASEYMKVSGINIEYSRKTKLKIPSSSKFPLRPEELATLKAHTPASAYHRMVLDSFLLACETGLRYSDITQLEAAHIQTHVSPSGDTIKVLSLTSIKTGNNNDMPLSADAIAIVNKYTEQSGKLFNYHYSQVAGKVLKKIFTDLGLNRPCETITMQGIQTIRATVPLHDIISFHMARNTYITRLLSANIAPAFVQRNVGHSDLKITMGYFRNDDVTRWQATLDVLNKKSQP